MIIATCGHQLTEEEGLGTQITVKDSHKDCSKTISYITVCNECLKWYKRHKLILKTEDEEKQWLS